MTVILYQGKLPKQFVDYYIYHNYLLMKGFKGPNPYFILGVTYLISKYKAYIWWLIISHLSIAVSDYCLCTVAVIGYNKDLNKTIPCTLHLNPLYVREYMLALEGFEFIILNWGERLNWERESVVRVWELSWGEEECWGKSVVWRRVSEWRVLCEEECCCCDEEWASEWRQTKTER